LPIWDIHCQCDIHTMQHMTKVSVHSLVDTRGPPHGTCIDQMVRSHGEITWWDHMVRSKGEIKGWDPTY
jgi:hypothetical protein